MASHEDTEAQKALGGGAEAQLCWGHGWRRENKAALGGAVLRSAVGSLKGVPTEKGVRTGAGAGCGPPGSSSLPGQSQTAVSWGSF